MNKQQIGLLRVLVVVFTLGALIAQIFVIPATAVSYADAYPEVAYLATPYTVAFIVAVVGIETALLAGWKILSIAKREQSLTHSAMCWVNLMTAGFLFTAVVMVGIFANACFFTNIGNPATLFGLLASIAFGAGAIVFRKTAKRYVLAQTLHGGGFEQALRAI